MSPTKLEIDNLTVDTFTTQPQPIAPGDDPAEFMIANCTGCVSGCGIFAQY
jgi:hypothetical protein